MRRPSRAPKVKNPHGVLNLATGDCLMALRKNRMAFVILALTLGVGCLPVGRDDGNSPIVRPPDVGIDSVLVWVCYSADLKSCFEGMGLGTAVQGSDFQGRAECASYDGGTAVFGTDMDCSDAFRAGAKSVVARCLLPSDSAGGVTNVQPASVKYYTDQFATAPEKDCQELKGEFQPVQ